VYDVKCSCFWVCRECLERKRVQRDDDEEEEVVHQCAREKLKKTGEQREGKNEDALAQRCVRGKYDFFETDWILMRTRYSCFEISQAQGWLV
jgi:hypothetical protein